MADDIVVQVGADISEFSRNMSKATSDLGSFGKASEKTFSAFKQVGTTVTAAGVALAGGLGATVKVAAEFDTALRRAGAIAGATESEFASLKSTAITLGANTSKSASEVAVAMENLAAKGFDATKIIAALPGVIAASEASGEDLALTADVVSSALNIWGLEAGEAGRVADVLAMSANISAAGVDSLGYSLKYAGAPAAALGIGLEEVAAAAGIMADAGLDGSNAGTSLRASLLRLNNPAKAQEEIMEDLGFSILDSSGKAKTLSRIVGDLSKSLEGESDAQKVATVAKLVGTEAVSGFLALMDAGPDKIDEVSDSLRNSAGASQEAADKMKAGIGGAIEELSGAFESAAIIIGDALIPAIIAVSEFIGNLVNWFNELNPKVQNFVATGAAVAAIFALIAGPLLLLVGFLPQIVAGFGTLGTVFGALVSPIGLIVAAVAAVVGALVLAYTQVEGFRESVNAVWQAIVTEATAAFESLKQTIETVVTAFVDFVKSALDAFAVFWKNNGQQILASAKSAYETIKSTLSNVVKAIVDFIKPQLDKIKQFWQENGQQILEAVKNAFNAIKAVIDFVMPAIQYLIKSVWEGIKSIISGALDVIMGLIKVFAGIFTGDFSKLWEGVKQIFSGAINVIVGWMNVSFVGAIRKVVTGFVKAVVGFIKGMWDNIVGIFTSSGNAVSGIAKNGLDKVLGFFTGFKTNVTNKMNEVKESITNIWRGAIDFIKGIDLVQIGKDTIQGLINGIGSMATAVWDKAKSIAKGIGDSIKNVLGIASPSKVTTQYGVWTGQGLANGIASTKGMNVKAAEVIAKAVADTTKTVNDQVGKIRKEAAAEEKAILEKKEKEIANILEKGAARKKGLTISEKQQIVRLTEQANKQIADLEKKTDAQIVKEKATASKQKLEQVQQYIAEKKSLDQLTLVEEAEINRRSIALFKEGTVERIKAQQNYQASLKAVNDSIAATNEEYANKVKAINDKLKSEEEALTGAYEKSLADRTASLRGFAGLFDEIDIRVEKSGAELLSNLAGQVDAFKIWQQQIDTLAGKAIDQGLLAELRELGPKALPQLIALNDLTDVQLSEYSALYQEKSRLAKEQASAELEGLRTDTYNQIEKLRADSNAQLDIVKNEWVAAIARTTQGTKDELSSLKQIGVDAGKGLLEGLASTEAALVEKARSIAQAVTAAMASALQIKSPSRVMRDFIGKNMIEGIIVGIESMQNAVDRAAKESVLSTMDTFGRYVTPANGAGVVGSIKRDDSTGGSGSGLTQNLVINSPSPLTPAEIARRTRLESQKLAMEVGLI